MKKFQSILRNLWGTKNEQPRRRGLCLESLEDRQMLSAVGWETGAAAEFASQNQNDELPISGVVTDINPTSVTVDCTTTKLGDTLVTLNAEFSPIDFISPGVPVGWSLPTGGDYFTLDPTQTLSYNHHVALKISADPNVDQYQFTIKATQLVSSKSVQFTVNFTEQQVPELNWSLADYDYTDYQLTVDKTYLQDQLVLSAFDGEEWTELERSFVNNDTVFTLAGTAKKTENLFVDADVMAGLGSMQYDGGNGVKDTLTIIGTDADDAFAVNKMSVTAKQSIQNPYEAYLNNLAQIKGEESDYYASVKAYCDAAYQKLQLTSKVTTIKYDTVSVRDGATFAFNGVGSVTIDGAEGDDLFDVIAYSNKYKLIGGDGEDKIDFVSAEKRVAINMKLTTAQAMVAGQTGTIALNGDIEMVGGTASADAIITAVNTTAVFGNGGADNIVLNGDADTETEVFLVGKYQEVVAVGDGDYSITIEQGDYSVINAASVSEEGSVKAFVYGEKLFDNSPKFIPFTAAKSVTIYGSAGDDEFRIAGDNVKLYGYAGDDEFYVAGSNALIYGGKGDDYVEIRDLNGEVSTKNFIYGENGDDAVNASRTSGTNYIYGGAGNDLLIGGAAVDYIYGQKGNDILLGLDGADYLYGEAGDDLIIASMASRIDRSHNQEALMYKIWNIWNDEEVEDKESAIHNLAGHRSLADDAKDTINPGVGTDMVYLNSKNDGDLVIGAAEFVVDGPDADED